MRKRKRHSKREHTAHDTAPMGMAGHDHHKMMIADFEKEFWICILITIPLLVFSPTIQHFFGYHLVLPGNKYILLVLSSFLYFWGGCFLKKGFMDEIKQKSPGMMTLIMMAIGVAYF